MTYENIELRIADAVAWLTLNRPQAFNALNGAMVGELIDALDAVAAEDGVRVVVLTGTGRGFCAGADLIDLVNGMAPRTDGTPDFLDLAATMYNKLRGMPKPVVGALNGLTLAGGLELALACDVLFAGESVKIGDGHATYGVFPGAGGAALLPERVGLNMAKYLLFSGRTLPASAFLASGFVSQVVPDADLRDAVAGYAAELAAKSPLALRRMKAVANATVGQPTQDALRHEVVVMRRHLRSYDMNEGLAAFREKRTPQFEGR